MISKELLTNGFTEHSVIIHRGQKVQIVQATRGFGETWFCAYVTLPGSYFRSELDNFFSVTFRAGDTIGFDTNHIYNQGMNTRELIADVLEQATEYINDYLKPRESLLKQVGLKIETIEGQIFYHRTDDL